MSQIGSVDHTGWDVTCFHQCGIQAFSSSTQAKIFVCNAFLLIALLCPHTGPMWGSYCGIQFLLCFGSQKNASGGSVDPIDILSKFKSCSLIALCFTYLPGVMPTTTMKLQYLHSKLQLLILTQDNSRRILQLQPHLALCQVDRRIYRSRQLGHPCRHKDTQLHTLQGPPLRQ